MSRSYADILALVSQKLQDTSNVKFLVAEVHYQIEESLKELASIDGHEHLVELVFQIESRTGTATSTSANNLVDATESQFVAGDATNEKVIHNTTDNTWAVVLTFTSSSILALSKDIMASGENYELYNKRCWNKKQIYIGDVPPYIDIDSVEYPIGKKRNWKVEGGILTIIVDHVDDSTTNVTTLPDVDVLVRFNRAHVLSQLTDWAGVLTANAAAAATSIAVGSLSGTEVVEEGEELYLENQKTPYTVTADVTMAAGAGTLAIYPGLEAAALNTEVITIVKSSLKQDEEEDFASLVAARLSINKAPKHFSLAGGPIWQSYLTWGERTMADTLRRLHRKPGKVKMTYSPY